MNRLREAREYLGFMEIDVARWMRWLPAAVSLAEKGRVPLTGEDWDRISCLYRRPVSWLKGEPAPPVEISPDLHDLMESRNLTAADCSELVAFAEWLQQRKDER